MVRQFKGSGLLFLRNILLYLLVLGPLVSVSLMGPAWPRLFLSLFLLSLIVLPPVAAVLDRVDGFSFDDARHAIIKPLGREIPYARIQRLDVHETSGLLRVFVRMGGFTSASLAAALSGRDKARLLEEFAKRAPQAVIRQRMHADWKSLLAVALAVLAAAGGAHALLYATRPALKIFPVQLPEAAIDYSGTRRYPVGDFDILLPVRFQPGKPEDAAAVFVDTADKTLLRAEAEARKESGGRRLLMLAAGMGDRAEVLERAFTARVGILPLLLKEIVLEGMDDVRIYSVRSNGLRGFITRGRRASGEVAFIALSADAGGASISLSLSGPKLWDDASLQRIAEAVSLRRK